MRFFGIVLADRNVPYFHRISRIHAVKRTFILFAIFAFSNASNIALANRPLWEAARNNNRERIKILLKEDPNVDLAYAPRALAHNIRWHLEDHGNLDLLEDRTKSEAIVASKRERHENVVFESENQFFRECNNNAQLMDQAAKEQSKRKRARKKALVEPVLVPAQVITAIPPCLIVQNAEQRLEVEQHFRQRDGAANDEFIDKQVQAAVALVKMLPFGSSF